MEIRETSSADEAAIDVINRAAFPGPEEATLVKRLLENANPLVSLIALSDNEAIAHILFSPVTLDSDSSLQLMGLAPMAVLPEHQNKGIGSHLVEAGLDQCLRLGTGAVVVLGYADYYPRFGFQPCTEFNIKSVYDVPADVFMIKELQPEYLQGKSGVIHYHPAFSNL